MCNHPDLFEARTIDSPLTIRKLRVVIFAHFLVQEKAIHPGFQLLKNEIMQMSSYTIQK